MATRTTRAVTIAGCLLIGAGAALPLLVPVFETPDVPLYSAFNLAVRDLKVDLELQDTYYFFAPHPVAPWLFLVASLGTLALAFKPRFVWTPAAVYLASLGWLFLAFGRFGWEGELINSNWNFFGPTESWSEYPAALSPKATPRVVRFFSLGWGWAAALLGGLSMFAAAYLHRRDQRSASASRSLPTHSSV